MIRMLVGLGNPGPEYEATRHNAGFWWIDEVARKLGAHLQNERGYSGHVARVNRGDGPLWLLKPLTFMNLSGKSVSALARFYKIEPQEILVAHDELDLPPGTSKLKFGGGHAGHNGLRDIHAQMGSADYWRLRIGIGHPGAKTEVLNWVLGKPQAEHRQAIDESIDRSITALDAVFAGDMPRAAALVQGKVERPKPERKPPPAASASASASAASTSRPHPPSAPVATPMATALGSAFKASQEKGQD